MNQTWVVVADSNRARIFARADRKSELQEVADLVHPEARLPGRELTSGRPGRTFNSAGPIRHAKQPKHSPHENAMEDFALEVARLLERGQKAGKFQKLILVAGPRFLGRLHQHLRPATAVRITGELHKNLVRRSEKTIRAHL